MIRRVVLFSLFCGALLVIAAAPKCSGQAPLAAERTGAAVLAKLGPVAYPAIAKAAHITGDVTVELKIRRGGSIESATAVSGPPLLAAAALESTQQSTFQCRNCADAITPYHMTYTFQLETIGCGANTAAPPQPNISVSTPRNSTHVTITDTRICMIDPVTRTKRRSWKCLYLWRCDRHL